MKKFYFLYKTTNLLNQKFYVGVHTTNKLDDGYLGSGKRIKYEITKYGKENFERIILEYFSSREEMLRREKEIINEEFINNELCLNLKLGGEGGWDYLNSSSESHRKRTSEAGKLCHEKYPELGTENLKKGITPESSKKRVKTTKEKYGENWYREMVSSIPRTKEWNEKISQSLKGRTGILSPNFGLKREKVKCPHCGKEGAKGNMKKWHFDNCKKDLKH